MRTRTLSLFVQCISRTPSAYRPISQKSKIQRCRICAGIWIWFVSRCANHKPQNGLFAISPTHVLAFDLVRVGWQRWWALG
ncbi:hypothetical protein GE21DRAFT_1084997 [Neurospora crassa]|nr:hypothetical protein GE21DRAFT_1084997 [Neurospora crassa]